MTGEAVAKRIRRRAFGDVANFTYWRSLDDIRKGKILAVHKFIVAA
jgi:hypothetical protein